MEGGDGETGEEVQERLRTIAELQLAAEGGQSAAAVRAHKVDDDDEDDLGFEEMGLDARLLRAIAKKGLSDPTPVQAKAVPLILEGKDVVARAKTGSGKTLSYLLPLVHKLLAEGVSKKGPSAMVLVPTRELCQQVYDEATSLAEYCGATLRVVQLATTMTTATLKMAMARVPDILVATPARIAACVTQNVILPAVLQESLSMLVLDEADLLFSYGYEEDIRSLAVHIPRRCQCLLMSATASPDVDKLKKLVLHNPVTLTLTEEVDGSGDTSVVPKSVQQFSINCKSKDKLLYTLAILKYDLIQKKAILFVNTIEAGFRLKLFLEQFGIKSAVLNGELPQNSRLHILQQFNVGLFEHLIATDDGKSLQPVSTGYEGAEDAGEATKKPKKAAGDAEFGVVRGIDFKNVRTVINYDMPEGVAGYIHRIGRTGRAGNAGISISLVSQEEEELLKEIKAEVSGEDEGSKPIVPFPLLSTTAVESLRYRAEDVMRGVTKVAVREARAKELRIEILNSERLKAHFEDNPTDLELLKHDKVLSKIAPAAHLKTVPEYLLDPTTEAASHAINLARAAMNLAQTSFVKRRKNKRVRVADPPTSFTKSSKRLKRDGRKGGKSEDGKSRSRNASKHRRRKRHFGQAQELKLEQAPEVRLEHAPEMRLQQAQEMKLESRRYSNACLDEEAEQARAADCVRLLQESILSPQDEDDEYCTAVHISQHPQSPYQYSLAIDFTAAKMVTAVINKCKLFQCVSSLFKDESQELVATLVGLHQILENVLSSPCIVRFHETLKDVLLYSTKAFAFLEKLCFKALPHESTHGVQKAGVKMNEFASRFFNLTARLCHDLNNGEASDLGLPSPRGERLSFGVTTYSVPVHNMLQRLLKKKRVQIPLTDLATTTTEYNVELSYPRSWFFSKDVAMSAKVESSDRGVSQTLNADRVNIEKGSWGWQYAQDTVLINYDDFVVANVASVTGGMLTYNKHSRQSSIKAYKSQGYRTSIQIVGASRIDLDLQDLFIKGVKEKELVFYKCFVNTAGREEVLAIYRFQPKQIKAEGMLHIVGRGNQPGLRHVLVSIFAALGFTPAA